MATVEPQDNNHFGFEISVSYAEMSGLEGLGGCCTEMFSSTCLYTITKPCAPPGDSQKMHIVSQLCSSCALSACIFRECTCLETQIFLAVVVLIKTFLIDQLEMFHVCTK